MGRIRASNISTPSNPAAGYTVIFPNTNKRYSTLDDAGTLRVLVDRSSSEVLSNKSIDDTCKIVDDADNTKVWQPSLGGMTAGRTLTIASTQSTSQTLNIPDITGSAIIITDILAQTITGVKTMTNMTTAAGTNAIPSMTITNGSNLSSAAANAIENDGAAFYATLNTTSGRQQTPHMHLFRLTADGGAIGAGIADYFGANSAFPFVTNGIYLFDFHLYFLKSTAGTVTWTLTNTQTYTNLNAFWWGCVITGFAATGATSGAGISKQTTAASALPVTGSLSTATDHYYRIVAIAECATAGNIRLRATESAGTITPRQGSYYTVTKLSAGNVGTFVA